MSKQKAYTLRELAEIAGGELIGNAEQLVLHLATDSRSLPGTGEVIFVAIRGKNHDGNRFIGEVYDRGIRSFLLNETPRPERFPGAGFIVVDDSLEALQKIAAHKRRSFAGEVIGITGSNGKTIIKEWLYQLMSDKTAVVRSPRSFNSQLGVPLSLWLLSGRFSHAIIEAGISKQGEMQRLETMIAPESGILTNIGTAHSEGFSSDSQKLMEKLKLFRQSQRIIYRADQLVDGQPVTGFLSEIPGKKIGWTLDEECTLDEERSVNDGPKTHYRFSFRPGPARPVLELEPGGQIFPVPFSDRASVENICHVIVYLVESGYDAGWIADRLGNLEPVEMRLQILKGIHGSTLVSDVYNADLAGLDRALDVLDQQKNHAGRTLIISDMFQSGLSDHDLYREVASRISFRKPDRFIGIGERITGFGEVFQENAEFFPDVPDFLNTYNFSNLRNHAILIKGSRRFRFERIVRELQLQYHKTVLEVDVNALVDNLNYFRSLLRPETRIMVMVKALSYGSGAHEIAGILQHQKVDYLAVAYPDEGVRLRNSGIALPIMVMNSDASEYQAMIDHALEPELFSRQGLTDFINACSFSGLSDYPVHIKLDTGMHRLGFGNEDLEWLGNTLNRPEIKVISVFSHLAGADDPEHDNFSGTQIALFREMAAELGRRLNYPFMRHILNSAGIIRFPGDQMEMVRLGIGLYGAGIGEQVKPVSTFRTVISQVRKVGKEDTVGYARQGRVDRESAIATIPVGYADGIDRHLGNGNYAFLVNGELAPTIGNICMDMTMINVTDLNATVGDQVELFGKHLPVEEMAGRLGTIAYEVFTGIPERVKRIYTRE